MTENLFFDDFIMTSSKMLTQDLWEYYNNVSSYQLTTFSIW